jgi:predicted glycosyltransferase
MKILFSLNHPAHYHLFKHSSAILQKLGHKTVFVIKSKDILGQLLVSENVPFHILTKKRVGHSKIAVLAKGVIDILIQNYKLFLYCRKYCPDLMAGTDYSITHVGKVLGIKTLVFNEDDYDVNKLFCRLAYPFATTIISPFICGVGKYTHKKIGYDGYQKLAYLHPKRFKPDINIVRNYFDSKGRFFLIRLVRFAAGHDIEMNHSGISIRVLENLVSLLEGFGEVYITSESKIPGALEKNTLRIDPKDIHHLLAFAELFIADSQSMIVEASVLGTPCIRFNSFVGKISVLEELQDKYKLAIGIHVNNPGKLMKQVSDLLHAENLKGVYQRRRQKMLNDKIDVTPFIVRLIEHYEQTYLKTNKHPDFFRRTSETNLESH